MSGQNDYISQTIERYIYQVIRRVPKKNQKDIEQELRLLIDDMLEKRCGALPRTKKDLDVVLVELGAPGDLAAQYLDVPRRSLIGPELFPKYIFILKIALLAAGIGLTVSALIGALINPQESFFPIIGKWLFNMALALGGAFTAVTLVFAFFEWRGIRVDEIKGSFRPEDLPPVPSQKARISKVDSIVDIVFSMLILLLLAAAPQLIAVYTSQGAIFLFELEVLHRLLPLLFVSFVCGLVRECDSLIEGRYTLRLAYVHTACNVLAALCCIFIFSQPIWNAAFVEQINAIYPIGEGYSFLSRLWKYFQEYFPVFLLACFLFETLNAWVRALRYGKAEGREPHE